MLEHNDVVILSGCRTAIGRFGGSLSSVPATDLGGAVIAEAVRRAGIDPALVDEALVGNVVSAGLGQAPARQAAIKGGLPADNISASAINKVCGSGLKTVMLGTAMIRNGDANAIVAAGMESMNNSPYMLAKARTGYRLGHGELLDSCVSDGLWCSFEHHHMGNSAEWIAREFGLTREELDIYALNSHRKAVAAIDDGKFEAEVVPFPVPQRRGQPLPFVQDECPRRDTSMESLGKLRPVFQADGMVTAGNAPGITDGAAAVVITSRIKAMEWGLQPMARVTGYAQSAVEPLEVFTAPAYAVQKLLARTRTKLEDYDLLEVNEAFAAQVVANGRALNWDADRVNVNGGAIALGHPIGCSGTRVLVTLLYALKDRGLQRGLATLCLGGGEAVALSVELE